METIVYDVGANDGSDIDYYLHKCDKVVAIEANPELCRIIRTKFATEIDALRLVVENCVVTAGETEREVEFYVHNENHLLSQFPKPKEEFASGFRRISLASKSLVSIIQSHGMPHYVKIDVEGYDEKLLQHLFSHGIRPPYISAESHSIKVFDALTGEGRYNSFKLVDGRLVHVIYNNRNIESERSKHRERHSFPEHSAGPFGGDVDGDWLDAGTFLKLIAVEGLGWKDIHATNIHKHIELSEKDEAELLCKHISSKALVKYTLSRCIDGTLSKLRGHT